MRSSKTTATKLQERAARLQEASERIYDPSTIEAKLSALSGDQSNVLMKLYRSSRSGLTANEIQTQAEMLRLYKDAASDVESDVFRVFDDLGGKTWDYNLVRRVGRDQQLLQQINNRIQALGGQVEGVLGDGLLDQFKTTWLDSAYRLDVLTPDSVNMKFGLLPDREIASILDEPWNGARFSQRLGLITTEMAQGVQNQIARSMISGEGWQDTARRIRNMMGTSGQQSVWRAEMIARTELAHAQTTANTMLYDDNSDVIEEVIWVAHPGACDECRANHGKPVSKVGYPPENSHPNCVCDILAVPKAWGGIAQTGDGDFSVRPQSRVSWARDNNLADVLESLRQWNPERKCQVIVSLR